MLIFAHRGAAFHGADENSVEAFCNAIEFGVDGIELDVRLTKDGEVIIFHDQDLRRSAGNNQKVEKMLWKDLRNIKMRHGSTIPLLDDVTACIHAPTKIDFEVKDHPAIHSLIRKLLTSKGLRERSMISSFKKEILECAEAEVPEVPRYFLRRRWPVRIKKFEEWILDHSIQGFGMDSTFWNARRCKWVHDRGIKVIAWEHYGVKSTRARAMRMRKIGIDIMIVNHPRTYLG